MDITCPKCGRINRESATFCGQCGHRFSPADRRAGQLAPSGAEEYVHRFALLVGRFFYQVQQEAMGWYRELFSQRPEVVGTVVSRPTPTTVMQHSRFYGPLMPAGGQSTQLPALGFSIRVQTGTSDQAVLMVGQRDGDSLQMGDKVRAWGVWDRHLGALRAWRVEVWERDGHPANYVARTGRPVPVAVISAVILGFVLMSCMCSLFTR